MSNSLPLSISLPFVSSSRTPKFNNFAHIDNKRPHRIHQWSPFPRHAIPLPTSSTKRVSLRSVITRTSIIDKEEEEGFVSVGEDSASFQLAEQKISSWVTFSLILGVVLFVLQVAWIDSSTGFGGQFIRIVSSISDSHEV